MVWLQLLKQESNNSIISWRMNLSRMMSSIHKVSTICLCRNQGILWLKVLKKVLWCLLIYRHMLLNRNGREDHMKDSNVLKIRLLNWDSLIKVRSTWSVKSLLFLNRRSSLVMIILRIKDKSSVLFV